jgi:hypothetical protein
MIRRRSNWISCVSMKYQSQTTRSIDLYSVGAISLLQLKINQIATTLLCMYNCAASAAIIYPGRSKANKFTLLGRHTEQSTIHRNVSVVVLPVNCWIGCFIVRNWTCDLIESDLNFCQSYSTYQSRCWIDQVRPSNIPKETSVALLKLKTLTRHNGDTKINWKDSNKPASKHLDYVRTSKSIAKAMQTQRICRAWGHSFAWGFARVILDRVRDNLDQAPGSRNWGTKSDADAEFNFFYPPTAGRGCS